MLAQPVFALGIALLEKDGRGVKLTDAGVRLRDVASDTFERLRSTCAELQRQTAEAPFVLGCPGSLLARWFIPRLDRLNRELPDLRLQLSASEGDLDPRRAGAHDPALIRPMADADLAALEAAARALPALLVTLAPEAATPLQITRLTRAGAVVSLGHSDCTAEAAAAGFAAGARAVTHLFNAMSQLQGRAPGLVGAALGGGVHAGIIADGVHVADAALRTALAATAPDRLFVVSDAMAVAGTDLAAFDLGGRRITRADGRLTLTDGTLAGADITLPQSVAHLRRLGCPLDRGLAMASRIPADLIGAPDRGRLAPGIRADFIHLTEALRLRRVWRDGVEIAGTEERNGADP